MEIREEFKKENGYGVMAVRQNYAGQRPYEDGFCDEYVEWLEAKVKKLGLHSVSNWVAIESNEQPEKVTSVVVKYKDGTKEVALFDGDGRYYIEPEYNDVTDKIVEWHRLP